MAKKSKKKKESNNENKLFIIFMTIALVVLLVVWIIKDTDFIKFAKETAVTKSNKETPLTKVTLLKALELIKEDKLVFIYLGYDGCSYCNKFTPSLKQTVSKYDMKLYYIDIKENDLKSKDWEKFTGKLNKKFTLNLEIDGKKVKQTKKIGEFLKEKGYTPSFVVFKNNKLVDGYIGALYKEKLEEFLDNAGFTKK